jgi:diguanylate cyclase (GGDEF)-like protein
MDGREHLARMFAALSATNEAILRTRSREELFQRVCDAAVHGGKFVTARVLMIGADGRLHATAGSAVGVDPASDLSLPVTDAKGAAGALAGIAFRTQRPCISNDFLNDERTQRYHELGRRHGVGAAAVIPILRQGASAGVFQFYLDRAGALDDEVVGLLERMVENVCFALDNFDREAERQRAERLNDRLARMFSALNATNEAILRSGDAQDMFQRVCDAASGASDAVSAAIFLSRPGSLVLERVAKSGSLKFHASSQMSVDPAKPVGQGLHGPAFHEQRTIVSNDVCNDSRAELWWQTARDSGIVASAALPLRSQGQPSGLIMFFFQREFGAVDDEVVHLMERIAENVSFGMDVFARNESRRQIEKSRERLSHMFAALSATNEAIMRAGNRDELYNMVCEAAVLGGSFTSVTIALHETGNSFLNIVACEGPNRDRVIGTQFSIDPDHPAGKGMTGTAFRTAKPCIMNDFQTNSRSSYWRQQSTNTSSGIGLPILREGRVVGVLLFLSSEPGAFVSELVELLQRVAANIAFALENFDRADEQKEAKARIEYLATHDGLTALPNRLMFNQLLNSSIKTALRHSRQCAVLFIDLDRFKIINDTLGHADGDTLLVEMAQRLKSCLRGSDVVARLGGDEFVVLLNEIGEPQQAAEVAQKLLSVIVRPVLLRGQECRVTASIGIAISPADGEDEQQLTKNADAAMYLAKEEGKNGFRFFSRQMKTQSIERLAMETSLRNAIDREEFSLHYQPKRGLETGAITGVEALLRWRHPDLGLLPPAQFIPLAEETGLIVPIGRWVMKTACAQGVAWQQQGMRPLSIAVNLSPRQFLHEGLLDDLDDVLNETGLDPELLEIEITESMVMQNIDRAIDLLTMIKSRGVRLAIDDFGTGYSSMSLIKRFPIDTLKIDRSFVRELPRDSEDKAIAEAIIGIGKALGLTIIAEGVETAEQERFLKDSACDEMQGYLLSRPVPADEIPAIVRREVIDAPPLQPEAPVARAIPAE